jgi:hypothetical protein
MPSPSLEQKYHHPSATPTPSNPVMSNNAFNSGHSCCGKSFASKEGFEQHFAAFHTPGGVNYTEPADHNAVLAEGQSTGEPRPFGE